MEIVSIGLVGFLILMVLSRMDKKIDTLNKEIRKVAYDVSKLRGKE